MTSTATLAASDFLANTGVNYLNPGARGLEPGDSVTINGPKQILFDTFASSPGDYVRVLTEFRIAGVRRPGMVRWQCNKILRLRDCPWCSPPLVHWPFGRGARANAVLRAGGCGDHAVGPFGGQSSSGKGQRRVLCSVQPRFSLL